MDALPSDKLPSDKLPSDRLGLRDGDDTSSAAAPGTRSTYLEPWLPRVRDIDEATLDALLRTLVQLRRIKLGLTALGSLAAALSFGILPLDNPLYALLIYGTLAVLGGLPVLGVGTLAVRRLFLEEGERQGLSKSASMLVLTRAERKARHLRPLLSAARQVETLREAVRDWDRA